MKKSFLITVSFLCLFSSTIPMHLSLERIHQINAQQARTEQAKAKQSGKTYIKKWRNAFSSINHTTVTEQLGYNPNLQLIQDNNPNLIHQAGAIKSVSCNWPLTFSC